MTMTPRQCELQIRPAEERDVPAIQRVAREAWEKTYDELLGPSDRREIRGHLYSERTLLEDVGRHTSYLFVATVDGAVVAFAECVREGSGGEVARIAVRPVWQRHGIAGALLAAGMHALAEEGVGEVTTGIEREDEPARAFFEAHGFRRVHEHASDLELPELELIEYQREVPERMDAFPERIEVWCDDGGRFCPRCHRRYRAGAEVCKSCGVSLVADPPGRPQEDDHRYVPVLRTADASRISLVSSALESTEIAFSVRGQDGPAGDPREIWVAPGREIEAREVIDRLEESAVGVEDDG